MSHPDGWVEGEGDLPFLPKQDGFDGVRRFFDDLLHREPTYQVICCVCRGEGRVSEVDESIGGILNQTCLACDGSGSVGMVRERKGTA